ncbi:Uncharacterised protein [Shigella sonnei]|nr:Uncharacterised protein [Shigella sonnei]CTA67156.1 Uncharacterised protein [Shigella sonnei]CTA72695.1 Uncharacterised protein [Shigella sonnei]CTA89065.1 Uncharacterised protein [Shigella sonnei]CTA92531.1 Uncharacterised protein [Shigella sonnei]
MGWQKCSGIKRSYLASQNLQTYCYHFEGRFGLIQALLYNLHSKFCGLSGYPPVCSREVWDCICLFTRSVLDYVL